MTVSLGATNFVRQKGLIFQVDPKLSIRNEGGLSYTLIANLSDHPTTQAGMDVFFSPRVAPATTGYTSITAQGHYSGNQSFGDLGQTLQWGGSVEYPLPPPLTISSISYGWAVKGYLFAPIAGNYEFAVDADDAADIFVNGTNVANFYNGHGFFPQIAANPTAAAWFITGSISLSPGWHTLYARFEQQSGGDGYALGWRKPGDAGFSTIPSSNFRPIGIANKLSNNPQYATLGNMLAATIPADRTSLQFFGNDNNTAVYINDTALNTQTLTISTWVRTNNLNQNGAWFCKGTTNQQYALFQEGTSVRFRLASSPSLSNDLSFTTATHMNTTNWFNVVATYTSGARILYVNGVQVASDTYNLPINTSNTGASIGALNATGARSYFYNGLIGNVSIFNQALSAVDVQYIFNTQRGLYGV